MKIRAIAIDDEPLALRQLAGYINKTPFLELTGEYNSAIEALEPIRSGAADLLFVDIQMPDLSGMDLVKSLKVKPMIIFTTAFSQYAVEGFRVDAVDYLLKPISYVDFLMAAQKALSRWEAKDKVKEDAEKPEAGDEYLFIKSAYRMVRIDFKDIRYIEGMREYVRVHLIHDKPVMTLMSMKSLEEVLPAERFMRVHRSFIVNLSEVKIVERGRIVFDKEYIPVGEQYKERFQQFLMRQ